MNEWLAFVGAMMVLIATTTFIRRSILSVFVSRINYSIIIRVPTRARPVAG
jgi:hypothetical protein